MNRIISSGRRAILVGCALGVSACVSNGSVPTSTAPAPQVDDSSTSGDPQGSQEDRASTTTSLTDDNNDSPSEALEPFDDFGWGSVALADSDGDSLDVLVASSKEQRSLGLMFVDDLEGWDGMWFVFDEPTSGGFWMYNTLMDLSIAWIDSDGIVVAVADMVPCAERPCPVYSPGADYTAALEVVGGDLDRLGISIGTRFDAPHILG